MLGPAGLGYQVAKDVFELLVLAGLGMAVARRLLAKPWRLENSRDAWITLGLIGLLMVTDFLADAAYIRIHQPAWQAWAPVSLALSRFLGAAGDPGLVPLQKTMWWLHLALLYGFANFLPYSKHFHVFTALPNIYFRDLEPRRSLKPMNLEAEHFGINRIQDFTWKQMLDFYSCVECGRCMENCPTCLTGKPLRPKHLGTGLRDYLRATPPGEMGQDRPVPEGRPLIGGPVPEGLDWRLDQEEEPWTPAQIGGQVSTDTIWSCTTCGYCEWACPLQISFVDKVVGMRRYLTLEESNFPAQAQLAFNGMERQGNPWNMSQADRAKWADGLGGPDHTRAPGRRIPVLGGLPGFLRRLRAEGVPGPGAAAQGRRCVLRHPRHRGVLLLRGGAAPGQRVPVPDRGRGHHRAPEGGRGQEDHHQLPPLPQHPEERVPGLRRRLRGGARHRAGGRAPGRRTAAHGPPRGPGGRLPRPLLPEPVRRAEGGSARHPGRHSPA